MPTFVLAFLVIFCQQIVYTSGLYVLPLAIFIFLGTALLPMLNIVILVRRGLITSYTLKTQEDRRMALFLAAVYQGLVALMVYFKVPEEFNFWIVMVAMMLSCLASLYLNQMTKISIHAVGTMGVLGFILGYAYFFRISELIYPATIWTFVCGLVASSRLYLQEHTLEQIIVGAFVGFSICFSAIGLTYMWLINS